MTDPIGFIGLGNMGRGMALNLVAKGHRLVVHDLVAAAEDILCDAGALRAEAPKELANRCPSIILCLPDSEAVKTVLWDENGIFSGTERRTTEVIDTTTMEQRHARAIADDVVKVGGQYWDCPVSGMPKRADAGTLTSMFGGSPEAFDRNSPVLNAFSERVIHCGQVGNGQAMKAVNNIIYDINIAALCEVLPFAVKFGLEPEALAQVVTEGSSSSFASRHFVDRMLAGAFHSDFSLNSAHKDIDNIRQMSRETDAVLPLVEAMIARYEAAIATGYGDQPKSAMIKLSEAELGVAFRKSK